MLNRMNTLNKLLLLFILFSAKLATAQDERPATGTNNWFLEVGGSGLFYSMNYEKYLFKNRQENLTLTARVGAGFNPIDYTFLNTLYLDKNTFMVPFTSSLLIGEQKDKLEVGAGFTMLTKNFNEREIVPTLILGLRVIESNRICFRISYVPLFRQEEYLHWLGVSLGMNFGKIK
jgi:hypothetical protein